MNRFRPTPEPLERRDLAALIAVVDELQHGGNKHLDKVITVIRQFDPTQQVIPVQSVGRLSGELSSAVETAIDMGAKVIVLPVTIGYTPFTPGNWDQHAQTARFKGAVLVAPAGNTAQSLEITPVWPAASREVLVAMDAMPDGRLWPTSGWSSRGNAFAVSVDADRYGVHGTSFSAGILGAWAGRALDAGYAPAQVPGALRARAVPDPHLVGKAIPSWLNGPPSVPKAPAPPAPQYVAPAPRLKPLAMFISFVRRPVWRPLLRWRFG